MFNKHLEHIHQVLKLIASYILESQYGKSKRELN